MPCYGIEEMLTPENGETKIVRPHAVGVMTQKLQIAKTDNKKINNQEL